MSDRDPGHRSRRSARFEIRPTLGRTALFNLVLSGGLLPPPRRCARNEKKDKRSLVEKEIDTGACLIDAHCKGLAEAAMSRRTNPRLSTSDDELLVRERRHPQRRTPVGLYA